MNDLAPYISPVFVQRPPALLSLISEAERPFYELFCSTFKVGKVISFRLASAKLFGIFGNNQQNVADETRRMFVPPPGFLFNQNDFEGAEAVAVAMLCTDGNFRECVRRKVKIHNFVCIKIFGSLFADYLTPAEVEALTPVSLAEHPQYKALVKRCKFLKVEYDLAKRTVHGSNYSMGWQTFQINVLKETKGRVFLTAAQCKHLLGAYFDLFPEVREYQVLTEEKTKQLEQIFNLFGHPARFVQRFTSALARLAISWGPQSTIGVATVLAALEHQSYIEKHRRNWHLHNIVHDSCLQSMPEAEAAEASDVLAKHMSIELTSPIDGWKFTIGVEKQIGRNWGKWDETENPEGLKVAA